MKTILSFFIFMSLFVGPSKGQALKKKIEDLSYEFMKAAITKDSLSFIRLADMISLTGNINKQHLDPDPIGVNDLYHVFIFRYSPWKITAKNREILYGKVIRPNFHFSGYRKVSDNNFYINMKWTLSQENIDSIGVFIEKSKKGLFVSDVRFSK